MEEPWPAEQFAYNCEGTVLSSYKNGRNKHQGSF